MSEEKKKAIEIVQGLKIYYDNDCLLDEEEIEENNEVNNAIDIVVELAESNGFDKGLYGLLMKEKEKNKELEIELDKTADLLNTCNKRLESISRELGLIDEHTYGYDYEEIFNAITELKVKEKYWQDCFLEQVKYGNKITISGDPIVIKNIINTVTYNYIHKDKIKKLLENEIIDICGFRCIAVEDIENLLEEK